MLKRKHDQAHDSSKRLSREHGASLKERMKVKGKFQIPTKMITKCDEETLKIALKKQIW